MEDRTWRQLKARLLPNREDAKRYLIQQFSGRDLRQTKGRSHQSLQGRHPEDLSNLPPDPLTRAGEGRHHKTRIPTSDDHQVPWMGQEDQVNQRVEAGPTQETTVADLRHSTRLKTLHPCLPYDRAHLWNKAFAHDLVARV